MKINWTYAGVALMCVTAARSQTVLPSSGLTTANGAADQAALCPTTTPTYPSAFTWNPSRTQVPARDATPADGLLPKIEQHRMLNGVDTIVAVWNSFGSNPYTCNEPFQTAPAQPAPGTPYTAAQSKPFTPAMLKAAAAMGCGPFGNVSHVDLFRLWKPGDVFLVYPAVYTSTMTPSGLISNNNITLHPQQDYYLDAGNPIFPPNNITIQGVTQNGIRPVIVRSDAGGGDSESTKDVVEILGGANDTIDNLSVTQSSTGTVLQSGIFLLHVGYNDYDRYGNRLATPVLGAGLNQTILSHLHVSSFEQEQSATGGANGIISDTLSGGTIVLSSSEIDHNGGSSVQNHSGAGHGVYLDGSDQRDGGVTYDPNFAVILQNNWFHDQFYGHDAKSRAQHTTMIGNYFQGGVPQSQDYPQAEAYNADISNGGVFVAYNNIFVKNASGYNSGIFNLAYAAEGFPSVNDGPNGNPRKNSIDIRFNTFVTFAQTVDGQHAIRPTLFFYPAQLPGAKGFPVSKVMIDSNAFVGYCPLNDPASDYRGTTALVAGFADLSQSFSFGGQYLSPSNALVGSNSYVHELLSGTRSTAAVGGED